MGRVAALRAELALAVLLLCSASHGLQASGPAAAMSEQTPDSPPEQRGLRAGRGETSSFDEPEDDEEQDNELERMVRERYGDGEVGFRRRAH